MQKSLQVQGFFMTVFKDTTLVLNLTTHLITMVLQLQKHKQSICPHPYWIVTATHGSKHSHQRANMEKESHQDNLLDQAVIYRYLIKRPTRKDSSIYATLASFKDKRSSNYSVNATYRYLSKDKIQCNSCMEWFHGHCVTIPENIW